MLSNGVHHTGGGNIAINPSSLDLSNNVTVNYFADVNGWELTCLFSWHWISQRFIY